MEFRLYDLIQEDIAVVEAPIKREIEVPVSCYQVRNDVVQEQKRQIKTPLTEVLPNVTITEKIVNAANKYLKDYPEVNIVKASEEIEQ